MTKRMNTALSLRAGRLKIALRACTPTAERYCRDVVDYVDVLPTSSSALEEIGLFIVTPEIPAKGSCPPGMPESVRRVGLSCHRAWASVAALCRDQGGGDENLLKTSLQDWRLWMNRLEPTVPRVGVYEWKAAKEDLFFCFVPLVGGSQDASQIRRRIVLATYLLAEHWHNSRGGLGRVHAAAVRRGRWVFLFLGPPGAGKSTAALQSASIGADIVDDDLVCIAGDPGGEYSVLSAGIWKRGSRDEKLGLLPPLPDVGPGVPLRAMFTLVQDEEEYLVNLSPLTAADALTRQALPMEPQSLLLSDVDLRRSLANCCSIARKIPAFELHFRKSPTFWKLVDEKLRV